MNLSVTSLIRYLKNRLDTDPNLQNISVGGELSNFRSSVSGHLYFTLKDEHSAVSCVMFSSKARSLTIRPKNGDKVIVQGSISMFESSGSVQLYVNTLRKDGIGDLYQQYEELKNRLWEEGLFDSNHKISIKTRYPQRIAVLCGEESAALSDIRTCFKRRWPLCQVDEYPVIVQGNDAPPSIISTLKEVDKKGYEAIILARGGGSFEDLFCFNDERLVRTIFNLETFIVSGVGHEQDFTLADFVADLRAPTPTAAVELITPDIILVAKDLTKLIEKLTTSIDRKLLDADNCLNNLLNRPIYVDPASICEKYILQISVLIHRLRALNNRFELIRKEIHSEIFNMRSSLNNMIILNEQMIKARLDLLKAYSIEQTLDRGFSIVMKNGHPIGSKDLLKADDDVTLKLADGEVKAVIKE